VSTCINVSELEVTTVADMVSYVKDCKYKDNE